MKSRPGPGSVRHAREDILRHDAADGSADFVEVLNMLFVVGLYKSYKRNQIKVKHATDVLKLQTLQLQEMCSKNLTLTSQKIKMDRKR